MGKLNYGATGGYSYQPKTVNVKLGGTPLCPRCEGKVYFNEEKRALGKVWHVRCFTCASCKKRLDSTNCSGHENEIYCAPCHKRNFGPKGYGSSGLASLPGPHSGVVGAGGGSTGTSTPTSTPSESPHNSPHHSPKMQRAHRSQSSTDVPDPDHPDRCRRCGKKVFFAEEVKALSRKWHRLCFKCAHCNKILEPGRCSEGDGELYCSNCYGRFFGPKGYGFAGGSGTLLSSDTVQYPVKSATLEAVHARSHSVPVNSSTSPSPIPSGQSFVFKAKPRAGGTSNIRRVIKKQPVPVPTTEVSVSSSTQAGTTAITETVPVSVEPTVAYPVPAHPTAVNENETEPVSLPLPNPLPTRANPVPVIDNSGDRDEQNLEFFGFTVVKDNNNSMKAAPPIEPEYAEPPPLPPSQPPPDDAIPLSPMSPDSEVANPSLPEVASPSLPEVASPSLPEVASPSLPEAISEYNEPAQPSETFVHGDVEESQAGTTTADPPTLTPPLSHSNDSSEFTYTEPVRPQRSSLSYMRHVSPAPFNLGSRPLQFSPTGFKLRVTPPSPGYQESDLPSPPPPPPPPPPTDDTGDDDILPTPPTDFGTHDPMDQHHVTQYDPVQVPFTEQHGGQVQISSEGHDEYSFTTATSSPDQTSESTYSSIHLQSDHGGQIHTSLVLEDQSSSQDYRSPSPPADINGHSHADDESFVATSSLITQSSELQTNCSEQNYGSPVSSNQYSEQEHNSPVPPVEYNMQDQHTNPGPVPYAGYSMQEQHTGPAPVPHADYIMQEHRTSPGPVPSMESNTQELRTSPGPSTYTSGLDRASPAPASNYNDPDVFTAAAKTISDVLARHTPTGSPRSSPLPTDVNLIGYHSPTSSRKKSNGVGVRMSPSHSPRASPIPSGSPGGSPLLQRKQINLNDARYSPSHSPKNNSPTADVLIMQRKQFHPSPHRSPSNSPRASPLPYSTNDMPQNRGYEHEPHGDGPRESGRVSPIPFVTVPFNTYADRDNYQPGNKAEPNPALFGNAPPPSDDDSGLLSRAAAAPVETFDTSPHPLLRDSPMQSMSQ